MSGIHGHILYYRTHFLWKPEQSFSLDFVCNCALKVSKSEGFISPDPPLAQLLMSGPCVYAPFVGPGPLTLWVIFSTVNSHQRVVEFITQDTQPDCPRSAGRR